VVYCQIHSQRTGPITQPRQRKCSCTSWEHCIGVNWRFWEYSIFQRRLTLWIMLYFSIDWTCHLASEVRFMTGFGHISPLGCSSCVSEKPAEIKWLCHFGFHRVRYLGWFSSSSTQLISCESSKVTIYIHIYMLMTRRYTAYVHQDPLLSFRAMCQHVLMISHSVWDLTGYISMPLKRKSSGAHQPIDNIRSTLFYSWLA